MVRGIASDRTRYRARRPYAAAILSKQTRSATSMVDDRFDPVDNGHTVSAGSQTSGIRLHTRYPACHPVCDHDPLRGCNRSHEEVVLLAGICELIAKESMFRLVYASVQ